jgi:hypothetical protein
VSCGVTGIIVRVRRQIFSFTIVQYAKQMGNKILKTFSPEGMERINGFKNEIRWSFFDPLESILFQACIKSH